MQWYTVTVCSNNNGPMVYRTYGTVRQAWAVLCSKWRLARNYVSGGCNGNPTYATLHNSNTGAVVACYASQPGYGWHVNAQHTLCS